MQKARRQLVFSAFLACSVIVHNQRPAPAEPPKDTASFFYDATGKRSITVSTSEFLVRVKKTPGKNVSARPDTIPARVIPDNAPSWSARLEDTLSGRGLHIARNTDRSALLGNDELAYALPVLYRVGSNVPIYMTDQLVVCLKPGAAQQALKTLADIEGCDMQPCARGQNRYLLRVKDTRTKNPLAIANRLHERRDMILYAHPDFILPKVTHAPPVIDDPLYHSLQWHLDGDVSKGAQPNTDVNAEAAWDTVHGPDAQGIPSVRVSILDECVEKFHPDLFPNWGAGLDLDVDPPDDDPSPDGGQRHGTSCAGVAVGVGNTIGVRGVAPNCGLIGVKFFGAAVSEMADGFYFSVDPNDDGDHSDGAAVLSNSWSFADGTLLPPDVVNAINFAANNGRNGLGCLVFFAAGNNDHTVNGVTALAQLDSTMAIGGTNSNGFHTEFSDVGPEVGVAAPTNDRGDDGVRFSWLDITTVDNTGSSGYNGIPDNLDYTNDFGGTSSATPLAAGVVALIISQDPTMTAAQACAILQHTAVRIDEPYGRFDGITSHSHRLGFGRVDAGAAVAAADAGLRWPDRIRNFSATPAGNDVSLIWSLPPNDHETSLVVRATSPFAWAPTDGETYNVSDEVIPGVHVIYNGPFSGVIDTGAANGGFFYGVYSRSSSNLYGFGARAHLLRGGVELFADNSEGPDPGWTHGGMLDEWMRGTPTSFNSIFGQAVGGSGPLSGLNGTRAIGGDQCWATDLASTYSANTDSYLDTPLINLTGVAPPVFLEYYDWCLIETFYDQCLIEIVDADGNLIGTVDGDTGGDYDWTLRVHDLSAFVGQPIKVRFRIVSDGVFQRDGWFIDEVRVVATGITNAPPVTNDVYAETTENISVNVPLQGSDPNLSMLSYVIETLPAHGTLVDPNGGTITSVPYSLVLLGSIVEYQPDLDYQGPDAFQYRASDGDLNSNTATASLSVGTPQSVFSFPFDTDPGWIIEGDWAFGPPQGLGGDPATAFTGTNVYGYNLAGEYDEDTPAQYLITQPFNCTGLSRVTLNFARWLGVEAGSFDKATIEASTDGINWNTIWAYQGDDLEETSWSQQSHSLSDVADDAPFVMIRWGMGPTDGNSEFAGWNIDDVVITAIGTASPNQPPLAKNVDLFTAINIGLDITLEGSDGNDDPVTYVIQSLPANGTLSDPNGGVIAAVPYTLLADGNVVHYEPTPGFADIDTFEYQADDGALLSNTAVVSVDVLFPAPFPFTEDFELGPPLADYWSVRSSNTGRVLVTTANDPVGVYHLTLDSASDSSFALNEVTLVADLEGASNVILQYDWQVLGDETHQLPDTWTNSADGDGVAISEDGVIWHRIENLFDPGTGTYETKKLDLDAAAAAAGLTYTKTFRIRFQQYDNNPIASDGLSLDNIQLIQGTNDPEIATAFLPIAQLNQPYGPVALEVIAGDPPFTWTVLDIYEESDLGSSLFGAVGTGQSWDGDDTVFDYTLPFTFPFYGENHTDIKIAVDGWINFGSFVGSTWNNSEVLLAFNKRIAVLWDDLRIDSGLGDIHIDESTPDQVTIRWDAVVDATGDPCNFSLTLFIDGRAQFDYGAGNTSLTPTIGVSSGNGTDYVLASYDTAAALTNANSLEMTYQTLPVGITLSPGGELSGTPTLEGTSNPTFQVEDASMRISTKQIALVVGGQTLGDFDLDTDVDEDDLDQFILCYTGDDGGPIPGLCTPGDFNGDNDVDCQDWSAFQTAFETSSGYVPTAEIGDFVNALLDPEVDEVFRCLSDVNQDTLNDGNDIQMFTERYLLTP